MVRAETRTVSSAARMSVTFDPVAVVAHLRDCGIAIEPVAKSGARGPIRSVHVRDPDGNLVEVSSYL